MCIISLHSLAAHLEEGVADGGVPLHGDGQGQVDAPREAHLGHRQQHRHLGNQGSFGQNIKCLMVPVPASC